MARFDSPVLLHGESGTGKEIVSRALHDLSPRVQAPFVAVNMGAIPAELAAVELFGAVKGAYSGAARDRKGFFREANEGTLFLDEIGNAPPQIQVQLLRALESKSVQPMGTEKPAAVDVRVISATDRDLMAAGHAGEFRLQLFHRISKCQIWLPLLSERREDFGRLFFYFLRQELEKLGKIGLWRPDPPDALPWIPATLVAELASYDYRRGNVRLLRNVVHQLVIASLNRPRMGIPAQLRRLLASTNGDVEEPADHEPVKPERAKYRSFWEVDGTELLAALREEGWNMSRTAKRLQVSRATLYKLIDGNEGLRKASEISRAEIEDARKRFDRQVAAMAAHLEVSPRGLQMRMKKLGF